MVSALFTVLMKKKKKKKKKIRRRRRRRRKEEEEKEEETTIEDADKCCVCQRFSPPPNLNDNPYLKIVNWAKCDSCSHWVHLVFCTNQRTVRRNDSFLCHHCAE